MKNLFTRVAVYTTVAIILSYIIPCEAGTTDDGSDKVLHVRPYVDPSQMDVPWPKHSHVKQPWRGFLETKPAVDLLEGIGICYHHGGNLEVQLALLAKAGIRCIRWEQPFATYDPDIGALAKHSEDRYREVLQACKKLGITPVILLNAHHGVPCKLKSFDRTVMADAPKSSTELLLNSVEGLRSVHSGTNGLTQYWAGEVLFTEVDNVRKAVKLSKPLPKALKKGERLNCVDLYYLPLHPVGTPEFEHTSEGWVGGKHVSRVRIWTFEKFKSDSAFYTPAMESRIPLHAVRSSAEPGNLPATQAGLSLSRKGVAVTAFGSSADSRDTLLRLWEQAGISGKLTVTLPKGLTASRAVPVDLRGKKIGPPIVVTDNTLAVDLRAYAPATFLLRLNMLIILLKWLLNRCQLFCF